MIRPMIRSIIQPIITAISSSAVALGDFYYAMGGTALNRQNMNGTTGRSATLSTPITLAIGDSIEFTYDAVAAMSTSRFFIHSGVGASNVGYFGSGTLAHGDAQLSNFTCTMNGVAIITGDDIIDSHPTQFPVTGYAPVRIILTATAETDIEYIGSNDSGASVMNMAIYDLKVVTVAQTYNWAMQTFNTTTQPETDADAINVEFTTTSSTYWLTWPYMENLGGDTTEQRLTSSDINGNDKLTQVTSLRFDGVGTATRFNTTAEYYTMRGDLSVPYADGYTIECIVKYVGHYNAGATDGRSCAVIESLTNSGANNLWCLRFDNFSDPTSSDVFPCFTLLLRDDIYHQATSDYVNNQGDVRSTTAAVSGQVYHLVGVIIPSTDTIALYVDGVLIGTSAINANWYDATGTPAKDVLDGSQTTKVTVGPGFIDGSWRTGQDAEIQQYKTHLIEADQGFIDDQFGDT